MSVDIKLLGAGLSSNPTDLKAAPTTILESWPPPPDFPILRNQHGEVISRYGDSVWDFSLLSGKSLVLNFGDGPQRKDRSPIRPDNAALLRQVTAWFLFGPRAVREIGTLKAKFKLVRPIFIHCSEKGILASDLCRYPAVIESLGAALPSSRFDELVSLLHGLYEQRDQLEFFILDPRGISRLGQCVGAHEKRQTAYIPPRIWSYIVNRCKEFIDGYLSNQSQIEDCYQHCLDRYAEAAGSLEAACAGDISIKDRPFRKTDPEERFADVCKRFGIKELLEKWAVPEGKTIEDAELGVRALSVYLGMVGYVGTLYLVAFSLMRIEEAWRLRCNCFEVKRDDDFGDVFLIRGQTTKTVKDSEAVWVTSKSSEDAVRAMSSVAKLRMKAAEANPSVPTTPGYIDNPHLVPRPYEPWTTRKSISSEMPIRQACMSLDLLLSTYPRLLDSETIRINLEDADIARRINPSLDNERFAVGNIWPLSWHQFRRTGAVNMFASGMVKDYALQHQLKHMTLRMTHYYAQGFSDLVLDESTRAEILRTMYEVTASEATELLGDDFVSFYGEGRRKQALDLLSDKNLKELRKLAKSGRVPFRETPFGGCTKPGPCEYGGFENAIHCGGGDGNDPCVHGILDIRKEPALQKLLKRIDVQLVDMPEKSKLKGWLHAQRCSFSNMIQVMNGERQ